MATEDKGDRSDSAGVRGVDMLQPTRTLTVISSPTSSTVLQVEQITPATVGLKAFGLAALPDAWVPSFVVVQSDALTDPENDLKLQTQLTSILECLGIEGPNVIVRSSGAAETMTDRGQLVSSVCPRENAVDTIRDLMSKVPSHSGQLHWIVQQFVNPLAKGHLSNERRLSREKRDWVAEFEISEHNSGYRTVAVRRWRDGAAVLTTKLLCGSQLQVPTSLKQVALWGSQFGNRLHFEWVWDGSSVSIVQADSADPVGATMVHPSSLRPETLPQIAIQALRAFRTAERDDFERFAKLHNAKVYADVGYQMPPFFVLTDNVVIGEILSGNITPELTLDLAELTKRPLIIRTDGIELPSHLREMLPRSDELRSPESAIEWLTTTFRDAINTAGLADAELCLIAHHFIPSVAAAWARAEPQKRIVRIESLWGLPEGLYWYSHDTFEVDTNQTEKGNEGAIRERLRHKGTFIAPDANGRWIPRRTAPPHDWTKSISRDAWIAEIAATTRRVADLENHPIALMWFIDNDERATRHSVLPWYHSRSQVGMPKAAPRRKLSMSRDFRIERVSDWTELRNQVSAGARIERVVIDPRDPELVRSQRFAEELSKFAAANNIVVELAGGILSHAYYMLQRHGAHVECVDLFGVEEDVLEFNKLVRDRIPEVITGGGEGVEVVRLSGDALVYAMRQKLVEEALEAFDAKSEDELIDELADVAEVISGMRQALQVSPERLEEVRRNKHNRRGGFEKGLMLKRTSLPRSLSSGESKPPLASQRSSSSDEVISDPSALPTTPNYRRVDLRNLDDSTERILTFETELMRMPDLTEQMELKLPVEDGKKEIVATLELNRSQSSVRGTLRLRVENSSKNTFDSDLQLPLVFPYESKR
jgi:predicted house-cleaning noncanonical NTP pyrophosphatase (MazG superfamily)